MTRHLPALDGLRALAITLVLWQHAGILFGASGLNTDTWFWNASRAGWWGVDLFFVLSGMLITRILLRQEKQQGALVSFWKRRAARTLPLLYVYLTVAAAYGFGGAFPVQDQPWLAYLTHTANWHIATNNFGLPLFGMLWSLGVEEQFYLVWPLILRQTRSRLIWVCLLLVAVGPIARYVVYQVSDCYAAFHVLPFCRVDTLAMGALLGVWVDQPNRWATVRKIGLGALVPSMLLLAAVTLLALGPWPMRRAEQTWVVFGYTLVGMSCCALVVVAANGGRLVQLLLANRVVSYLGKISYGIYLWHCLVALVVVSLPLEIEANSRLALWLVLVVSVSTLSWYGIERVWLNRMTGRLSAQG